MVRIAATALLLAVAIASSGCGGGSSVASSGLSSGGPGGLPDPPTGVIVTPNGVGQVWQGTTVQFQANVGLLECARRERRRQY